jgi:hypothetical protein
MAPSSVPGNARDGTIAGRLALTMVPTQALPGHSDYAIAACLAIAGMGHIATYGWSVSIKYLDIEITQSSKVHCGAGTGSRRRDDHGT